MKKPRTTEPDELRPEYDFSAMKGGVRGKYAEDRVRNLDYRQSRPNRFAPKAGETRIAVVLEPDVAKVFGSAKRVNQALRRVIRDQSTPKP